MWKCVFDSSVGRSSLDATSCSPDGRQQRQLGSVYEAGANAQNEAKTDSRADDRGRARVSQIYAQASELNMDLHRQQSEMGTRMDKPTRLVLLGECFSFGALMAGASQVRLQTSVVTKDKSHHGSSSPVFFYCGFGSHAQSELAATSHNPRPTAHVLHVAFPPVPSRYLHVLLLSGYQPH